MTAMLRAVLFAALTASSLPAVAAGQTTSSDSLLRRIDFLERRVADLERRVRELEAPITVEPARDRRVSTSPNWRDLQNWRQLRRGMTMDQVRALLGEPERVDAGHVTFWRWADAEVYFTSDKLEGWSEPRR
jgi:hypothetical protein